jgi:SAM-dependent methyltransferase
MRQGAASVIGFDASETMLERARQQGPDTENLRFSQVDLDQLDLGEQKFDLIVSGLALHYVADFPRLAGWVAQALRPGGCFVFSVEHPVITCSDRAWVCREDGSRAHWPVDHYLDEGPRAVNWLGFDDVPRYHRTVSGYVEPLLEAGLTIRRLLEPGPSTEDMEKWPRLADQRRRPAFLVVRADKPVV